MAKVKIATLIEGFRVQIPAYTDRWMKGDRYGNVRAVKRQYDVEYWQVLLDKSNKLVWFVATECTVV